MAEKKYSNWKTVLENEIFWLLLDRPEKKNAFNDELVDELNAIIENDIEGNIDNIRCVIYGTTQDTMFSAGADLEWFFTLNGANARQASINSQVVFNKFENLPVPVIAEVKGLILTAGLELMMCADIIIASENAKFGQVETKYGITPGGGGTQRLTRLVGTLKARELIYTAKIIDAKEAKDIGLVNEVVPLEFLDKSVREMANSIIKNSKRAVSLSKRLIQLGTYTNMDGFYAEGDAFANDFASNEPQSIIKKFFEQKK